MDHSDRIIRPAMADDAPEMARLIDMAGGGVYEFLLDGLVPGLTAAEMLVPGLAGSSGSFSHRHSGVAEADGRIVGVAHAYPVDWMRAQDYTGLPPDRLAHMADFSRTQDWGSYFLSALAVDPDWRRRGIARSLLAWVYKRARTGGFDRVTLHVWADNTEAQRLYAAEGFEEVARADVPWHERLPHRGGSLLLRRRV
ncbi:GNAT family N-acetyltransferase [Azospirillum canadense]|uniref:GNAT family N-acetyltransferase n=1 Tax=Azospirillum canadense TaxID=403962 RepID=UPI002226BF33|nr:GNAT family N-acetyltransferase [Azospirillum canadense]MCW2237345.1 ribosomal protein S18 acetylase RimI-like enzyme [Azospirillum canadense]